MKVQESLKQEIQENEKFHVVTFKNSVTYEEVTVEIRRYRNVYSVDSPFDGIEDIFFVSSFIKGLGFTLNLRSQWNEVISKIRLVELPEVVVNGFEKEPDENFSLEVLKVRKWEKRFRQAVKNWRISQIWEMLQTKPPKIFLVNNNLYTLARF